MSVDTPTLAEFRHAVSLRARQVPAQWEASKELIAKSALRATLVRLLQRVQERDMPDGIKEILCRVCESRQAERVQDLDDELLKILTGFPPAKALRALCVFFELIVLPRSQWPVPNMSSDEIERCIRRTDNPFNLLGDVEVASVLDIGAGDLSFAQELLELYGPKFKRCQRQFIVHCLDRLDPHSKLGGPLHPRQETLRAWQETIGVSFAFFGNQDMFDLRQLDERGLLAPRYTIATCWAPATPTFAYEPTRLSETVIKEELRRTKGSSRLIRFHGEPALEVHHGGRDLIFPPWKFEIVGPLALLRLMACRGSLCVLGSVDDQVFWELLAQLLEASRYRPQDQPFTATTLPQVFGEIYQMLNNLSVGDSIDLSDMGILRRRIPGGPTDSSSLNGFRSVRIRRGATFPGLPASSTARKFSMMVEEHSPWFLTLVPD